MTSLLTLAYLDPGSGSMILQAIVGGAAGIMVLFRHLYRSWKYRAPAETGNSSETETK